MYPHMFHGSTTPGPTAGCPKAEPRGAEGVWPLSCSGAPSATWRPRSRSGPAVCTRTIVVARPPAAPSPPV
jgi:hypothetical protein